MNDMISSFLKSRRFWVAAAGVAFVVLKDRLPGITEEQVTNIALMVGAWIVGESLRSSQEPAQ
jgi:hypothetical protein